MMMNLLILLSFPRNINSELRFIEYMDVGGATDWKQEKVVGRIFRDIKRIQKNILHM